MTSVDRAFHDTPKVALNTQLINSDTTTNGVILDTTGFEALTFVMQVGVVTAGDVTMLIRDGDDSGLSDVADVTDDFLIGLETATKLDTSNTVAEIGYVGKQKFVRSSAVTDNSADLTINQRGQDGPVLRSFEKGKSYEIKDEDLVTVFLREKWAIEEPELFDDEKPEKEIKVLKDMTKKELLAYAEDEKIKLYVTTKSAMIDTIMEAEAVTETEEKTETD